MQPGGTNAVTPLALDSCGGQFIALFVLMAVGYLVVRDGVTAGMLRAWRKRDAQRLKDAAKAEQAAQAAAAAKRAARGPDAPPAAGARTPPKP